MCFPNILVQKTKEYLNFTEKITRNWNVNLVSALITSWDITYWCRINLLWKELMGHMNEHTGLIRSYQLLITTACTNKGGKMKGCRARAADRCPFVHRHSKSQATSFMGFPVVWCCGMEYTAKWQHLYILYMRIHVYIWIHPCTMHVYFCSPSKYRFSNSGEMSRYMQSFDKQNTNGKLRVLFCDRCWTHHACCRNFIPNQIINGKICLYCISNHWHEILNAKWCSLIILTSCAIVLLRSSKRLTHNFSGTISSVTFLVHYYLCIVYIFTTKVI